ncbi:Sodium/calcium exchanger protein [Rhizophagus diaphanus]|nr:Sodium/calcium exchanger protein [Rhizophagus diaphanus] [Rhizophagus sp. MUCL 43196]
MANRKSNNSNYSITNESTNSSWIPSPPGSRVSHTFSITSTSFRLLETNYFYILTPWIALLLVFIPLGYIAHAYNWSDAWVFILNFLAIIPLAILFEYAIDDISLRFGQTIGDLLLATFSNTVEIIVSITALKEGQIRVVQDSILGSIILNLLLILGISFTRRGISSKTQKFNQIVARTSSSLMTLACIALIIPAAFVRSFGSNYNVHNEKLSYLSYGTAMVLLIIYILYLVFQLKTHSHIFQRPHKEDKEPKLPLIVSLILLATVTCAVAFSEYLVSSIEGIVHTFGITKAFIGLIILPIVNKASELLHTLSSAANDEIDLDFAISLAAGSSMHIAFFVSPLLVILGWVTGQEMTLNFQSFETVVLFISVLMTYYIIQNGESNWLKGVLFLATYVIIAIAFFFYPDIPSQHQM